MCTSSLPVRETGRERKRETGRERKTQKGRGERERERERERNGERERKRERMTGALAPFSYLVYIYLCIYVRPCLLQDCKYECRMRKEMFAAERY